MDKFYRRVSKHGGFSISVFRYTDLEKSLHIYIQYKMVRRYRKEGLCKGFPQEPFHMEMTF